VGLGELSIEELVSPEKVAEISRWYIENRSNSLLAAKAELGDNISYSELKYVLKYLVFSEHIAG